MKRREFIALLGGVAAACPVVAWGQQPAKIARISFFGPDASKTSLFGHLYRAFFAQLQDLGFHEGQNLIVTFGAIDDPRGLSAVATELAQSQTDLIVVSGTEAMLQAVLALNRGIPVVLIAVNFDPIARGYIASLTRPGGNITGVVFQQLELAQKQVELLTQAFPGKTRLSIMFDGQSADQFSAAEQSARSLNLQVQGQKLEKPPYDFDDAFRSVVANGAQMLLVQSTPHFSTQRARISELAKMHHLPAMFLNRFYVDSGGLMSYGADFPLMYRRTADYVAKVLRGAKPADLPIEQANKFDLVVNLKTAKAIGIELPTSILLRADEVIE